MNKTQGPLLACLAIALALAGCASSRRGPFDTPRTATVIGWTAPESPEAAVMGRVHAGIFGVLGGLKGHAAVDDACGRALLVEMEDNREHVRFGTRCHTSFAAGQRVALVRDPATDPRDLFRVRSLP